MDPCDRSVCREARRPSTSSWSAARSRSRRCRAPGWKMTFQTLTLKTSTTLHDNEVQVYQVPIAECIDAAHKPGGGIAWLDSQAHAEEDYEPIVTKAIARHAAEKRVALAGPPSVKRGSSRSTCWCKVRGDRARTQQQAIDAFAAGAAGLRDNPKTPAQRAARGRRRHRHARRRAPLSRARQSGRPVPRRPDVGRRFVGQLRRRGEEGAAADVRSTTPKRAATAARPIRARPIPTTTRWCSCCRRTSRRSAACARAEAAQNHALPRRRRHLPAGTGRRPRRKRRRQGSGAAADSRSKPVWPAAIGGLRLPRHNAAPRTIEYPIRVK